MTKKPHAWGAWFRHGVKGDKESIAFDHNRKRTKCNQKQYKTKETRIH